jgi:hypothetical protein
LRALALSALWQEALSATFDRLGNNATLALSMLPRLGDLQLVPKQARAAGRAVLEVYPALAKMGAKPLLCGPSCNPTCQQSSSLERIPMMPRSAP